MFRSHKIRNILPSEFLNPSSAEELRDLAADFRSQHLTRDEDDIWELPLQDEYATRRRRRSDSYRWRSR